MFIPLENETVAECREANDPLAAQRPAEPRKRKGNPVEKAEASAKRGRAAGDNSSLQLYLTEIGEVKLLTPEEELDLAARIKKGDTKAREHMIKANLRLVVKIARGFEGLGLPLLDLISEGNIGLMKAVERFDPSFGAKVSTYAAWWIKQSMKRALANQSKTIRVPVHMVDKISKMHRAAARLHQELGREPTDDELGLELKIAAFRVTEMRMAACRPASLDAPVGGDESISFGDVVPDERAETPLEKFEGRAAVQMLRDMVNQLAPREAQILRARFGLDGSNPKSLDEIGAPFGVSRERIRQLQNRALSKLRKGLKKLDGLRLRSVGESV